MVKKMKIYVKYRVGEEVYAIYKEDDGIIRLWKDKINSITIRENNVIDYLLEDYCETFSEHELVKLEDEKGLLKKINELIDNEAE